MKRTCVALLAAVMLCGVAMGQDPNTCVTAWVLGGQGMQEIRLGYDGLLPDIEVAVGLRHNDAPPDGVEQWPVRAYLLAHALDAEMLASIIGNKITLPSGNLYCGLFAEYTYDRDKEFSGGYVLGGEVDWPRGWKTVVEYDVTIFNTSNDAYQIVFGLKREF